MRYQNIRSGNNGIKITRLVVHSRKVMYCKNICLHITNQIKSEK